MIFSKQKEHSVLKQGCSCEGGIVIERTITIVSVSIIELIVHVPLESQASHHDRHHDRNHRSLFGYPNGLWLFG